jgi:hypothetical protein
VTQTFAFQGAEAVSVSVTIQNNTDDELSAGLRFLLDTCLGEAGFPHFRTDREREINTERSFSAADMPAWWSSRSSRSSRAAENPSLLMPLSAAGVTTPDRLVLANWKRLNDSSWLYETAPARNFSELPYSINDSAACLYYGPAPLPAGASRTYLLVLSGGKEPPPAAPSVAAAPAAAPEATPSAAAPVPPAAVPAPPAAQAQAGAPEAGPSPAASLKLGIEGDLRVLDDLLQKLALKMDSKTTLSEEEQRLMEQVIADLKKRLESYGD